MIQAGVFLLVVAVISIVCGMCGRFIATISEPPPKKRPEDIWASTYARKAVNRTAGASRARALVGMTPTLFKVALASVAVGVPTLAIGILFR